MTRALVLGGGGLTGIAWETGVLVGLRDSGVDVTSWDLVVGTSAGAIVGAKLLGDPDLDAYYAAQTQPARPEDDLPIRTMAGRFAAGFLRLGRRRGLGWTPRIWLAAFAAETLVRQRAGRPARRRRGEGEVAFGIRSVGPPDASLARLGSYGFAARTASEAVYLKVIEEALEPVREWPAALTVTAIDAVTGAPVVIDAGSGVPFRSAVAASCAVPGLMPSVTIGGRRYMDGGMGTPTGADAAAGHHEVVVIAPLDFGRLAEEAERLRAGGSHVTLITPGPEARRAFGEGISWLDPVRRAPSARGGRDDGLRAGGALRDAGPAKRGTQLGAIAS